MAYNHEYPYVDSGMSNADWILHKIKEMIAEWATMQDAWKELQEEFKQLNINFTDLENQFKQLITENNEFKTSITGIVNQFKADITQQFNEYKTEINEALSTFEQHITEEFTDLSNYVQTTINNLPTEVKNIFQTYIDDGTIEDMLKGIIPPDVSAQVEKNTNDISAIKTEQTTQNNKISNLETWNTTLEQTVTNHTSQISALQTEQSEIMNDIADINELDATQNNRLDDIELRIGRKFVWYILDERVPTLISQIQQNGWAYIHNWGHSLSTFNTTLPELAISISTDTTFKPAKNPDYIIIVACPLSYSAGTDYTEGLRNISNNIRVKYPYAMVYFTSTTLPNNSSAYQRYSSILSNTGSAWALRPQFNILIQPTLSIFLNDTTLSTGDFRNAAKASFFCNILYRSIFSNYYQDMTYEIPITLAGPVVGQDSISECWVSLTPTDRGLRYHFKMIVPGFNISNWDLPGSESWLTVGHISSSAINAQAIKVAISCRTMIGEFSRDNRVAQVCAAGGIQLVENQQDGWDVNIHTVDSTVTDVINGFQLETTTMRFWNSETQPAMEE